jgi:glycogen debranching enzyme
MPRLALSGVIGSSYVRERQRAESYDRDQVAVRSKRFPAWSRGKIVLALVGELTGPRPSSQPDPSTSNSS